MYKPFLKIQKPREEDYKNLTENVEIYSYSYSLEQCYYCGENCRGTCVGAVKNKEEEDEPIIDIKDMDLQKLLNMIPKGLSPADIKMDIAAGYGDGGYEDINVEFYYKKALPDKTKEYNKHMKEYLKAKQDYDQQLAIYNAWVKEKEIKNLEARLEELKNG